MPAPTRLLSLNAATDRMLDWRGRTVQTGMFKAPVEGPRWVCEDGLEGDRVVDRRYHGAEFQALYAYPGEHYASWREAFPALDLGWGAFGENLSWAGWDEDTVHIGDRFRVGTAEVEVTQPRWPCFKLGRKLRAPRVVKRMLDSGKTGFYLRVLVPGAISTGDPLVRIHVDPGGVPVLALPRLTLDGDADRDAMAKAAAVPALPALWRDGLLLRIGKTGP